MAEVTAKSSVAGAVQKRVRERKCLVCDTRSQKRGLCPRHYALFLRQLKSHDKKGRIDYEQALIREGKVLACHQVYELRMDDPFAIES